MGGIGVSVPGDATAGLVMFARVIDLVLNLADQIFNPGGCARPQRS
jgi:methylthioribose-1-phosphate isomerase